MFVEYSLYTVPFFCRPSAAVSNKPKRHYERPIFFPRNLDGIKQYTLIPYIKHYDSIYKIPKYFLNIFSHFLDILLRNQIFFPHFWTFFYIFKSQYMRYICPYCGIYRYLTNNLIWGIIQKIWICLYIVVLGLRTPICRCSIPHYPPFSSTNRK